MVVALELGSSFRGQLGGLVPQKTAGQVRVSASAYLPPFWRSGTPFQARPLLSDLNQWPARIRAGLFGLAETGPKRFTHVLEPKWARALDAAH